MKKLSTPAKSVGALSLAALTLALSACSGDTTQPVEESAGAQGSAISEERCALNKAAGTVTYLSGYQYQASASILEVLAAEKLGYFDDLCIDLEIQPGTGDTGQNTQLLASDQVQFTPVGQQNLIQARDTGIEILGISSYSNVGLEILMTMPEITELDQLDGTILGHKGNMPAGVQAMLDEAGTDVSSIQQVTVGYDPTVLTRHQVDSLTGFISNEPNLLAAAGEKVTVWRPYDYGVPSSLGAMAVNPKFAAEHPTVVEDFLRASLHAMSHCAEHAEECVEYAAEISGEGYDVAHNVKIWQTEYGIIEETEGDVRGAIDAENVLALNTMLSEYALLEKSYSDDEVLAFFDNSFIEAIFDKGELVWPAP